MPAMTRDEKLQSIPSAVCGTALAHGAQRASATLARMLDEVRADSRERWTIRQAAIIEIRKYTN